MGLKPIVAGFTAFLHHLFRPIPQLGSDEEILKQIRESHDGKFTEAAILSVLISVCWARLSPHRRLVEG